MFGLIIDLLILEGLFLFKKSLNTLINAPFCNKCTHFVVHFYMFI